jgi:hypothetical protein
LQTEKHWNLTARAKPSRPPNALSHLKPPQDVLAERLRQISAEGWTPEHDDKHTDGELTSAAVCYAIAAFSPSADKRNPWKRLFYRGEEFIAHTFIANNWPWDRKWWKSKSRRRDLVKAAALILAEIERLDRATAPKPDAEA